MRATERSDNQLTDNQLKENSLIAKCKAVYEQTHKLDQGQSKQPIIGKNQQTQIPTQPACSFQNTCN